MSIRNDFEASIPKPGIDLTPRVVNALDRLWDRFLDVAQHDGKNEPAIRKARADIEAAIRRERYAPSPEADELRPHPERRECTCDWDASLPFVHRPDCALVASEDWDADDSDARAAGNFV